MSPWIETYSGKRFNFLAPDPDSINIEDIAHALANTCRFTGHCSRFYSVAEHSLAVAQQTKTLEGLLHDATEAYLTDISTPLKLLLPEYKKLEENVYRVIADRFGFYNGGPSAAVKLADLRQLSIESRYLLSGHGNGWEMWARIDREYLEHDAIKPRCIKPGTVKWMFLDEYERLKEKNVA